MKSTDFLDKLNQRYACKAMTGETIPEEKVERILEAARLAPTSSGLQPFEIYVITVLHGSCGPGKLFEFEGTP